MQGYPDLAGTGTSAGYRFTLRARIAKRVGMLGKLASAISEAGGSIVAIDVVQLGRDQVVRDVTVDAADEQQQLRIVDRVAQIEGIEVLSCSDRTFAMHQGGKLEIVPKRPLKTRDDLSMAYTPGVARVSRAIHQNPERAFQLTIKSNTVAVVTDGSAVLGLGNVGPEAALPVMEGKAVLFKEFAGVDAFPIALATQNTGEIVETVRRIAPVFGAINLEDITAPRCFEVEDRLRQELDIPVFHDDQHGTAIVVAAALLNSVKVVGKRLEELKVVVSGVGAAGVASTKILLEMGVRDIVACDRVGAIYLGRRKGMNPVKDWIARHTNPRQLKGSLHDVLRGADFFLGVSAPGLLSAEDVRTMDRDPIVFALANPIPEIMPEEAEKYAAVVATGRSDYPNQVNNVLAFPGVFRGALDCRAGDINEAMNLEAARAIAGLVSEDELSSEHIIPSVFDRRVAPTVARAVARAGKQTGVAREDLAC
ncbi:MAG: malic enzyme-like NAD(P)-binding protein [Chloroflexota bacterium]